MIPPRGTSCSGPCSPGLAGHLSRSALTTLALSLPPGPGSPHTKSFGPQGPYGTIQLHKGNKKQIQKPKEVPTRHPGQHLSQDSEREFSFPTDAHRVPRRPQGAQAPTGCPGASRPLARTEDREGRGLGTRFHCNRM